MNSLMQAAWRLLISRRFAVGLLMVIATLLLPGVLLPTEAWLTTEEMEALRQNNPLLYSVSTTFDPPAMARSWTFISLNILLAASTVLCSIERIRNRKFKDPQSREPKYFRQKRVLALDEPDDDVIDRAIGLLRRSRWRLSLSERAGKTILAGRKGDFGFWGSIIFHLGFLVLLLGVLISARTRLSATLLVAEAQTVSPITDGFTAVSRAPDRIELPDFKIRLDTVQAEYKDGRFPINYNSRVTFLSPSGERAAVIGVNKAAKYANLIFLMENYGYAPAFIVREGRRELLNAVINLKGREPGAEKDSFDVPEANIRVETQFFPDYYEPRPRQAANRSLLPNNPVYMLKAIQGGRTLYKGPIALGKKVKLGRYELEFRTLRRWGYFRIKRDGGVLFIFWGLVFAATGLVIRFVLHEKRIHLVFSGNDEATGVIIAGKSRYFPALFVDEIDNIAGALESGGKARRVNGTV